MNAAIFLTGLPGEKSQPVENFYFDIDKDKLNTVKNRLIELQKGYCVEGEKPRLKGGTCKGPKGNIKVLEAFSSADYSYVAYLAQKIKTLPVPEAPVQ